MNKLLVLDDFRDPNNHQYTSFYLLYFDFRNFDEIIWVKDHYEFVDYIKANGLPTAISFDHDLSDEHYRIFCSKEAWEEYHLYSDHVPTGYDSAKFLIDYCFEKQLKLPIYYAHTQNPAGRVNILSTLNNYKKKYE